MSFYRQLESSWQPLARFLCGVPVEPQQVFGTDTFCKPTPETKGGERYRWRYFLFADLLAGVPLFSAEGFFVS
jgi:hypothetical protein